MSRVTASMAVMAERKRQGEEDGQSVEDDDKLTRFELAFAAAAHCLWSAGKAKLASQALPKSMVGIVQPQQLRRDDLVRAGALIQREIERIDRKEKKS